MTHENPDIPQQLDYESKTLYLKEALRLSELMIEHQNKAFDSIERKAVLLTSLCIAIIGYLLSWDISDKKNWIIEISLIAILVFPFTTLAIAAWISSSILFPRSFAIPGVNPKYLMQSILKYDFNKMAENLLKSYDERYEINKKIIAEKTNTFEKSLRLGIYGILCAGLWIIINFGALTIINILKYLS